MTGSHFLRPRRLLIGAVLLLSALAGWAPARAADPYTVSGVAEDITAENANVARQKAFSQARHDAFVALMQRLASTADQSRVPSVSDADLDNLVLAIQVEQEKRSTVRYIATLAVRFRPDMVLKTLSDAGITVTQWRGKPVAVLPVLQTQAGPILWESPNPWADAWRGPASEGVVPFAVPATPPNQGAVLPDAVEAAAGGAQALDDFTQRLGVPDLLIAVLTPQPAATPAVPAAPPDPSSPAAPGQPSAQAVPPQPMSITLTTRGTFETVLTGSRAYTPNAGETQDQFMGRIVADVASFADDAFKGGDLVPNGPPATLAIQADLTGGLADWAAIRDKLGHAAAVRSYQVTSVARNNAGLVLTYEGDTDRLQAALLPAGLVLTSEDGHWILRNVVARPATQSQAQQGQGAAASP